ncbi:hypothetical protein D3C85_1425300 [compost metagenome]
MHVEGAERGAGIGREQAAAFAPRREAVAGDEDVQPAAHPQPAPLGLVLPGDGVEPAKGGLDLVSGGQRGVARLGQAGLDHLDLVFAGEGAAVGVHQPRLHGIDIVGGPLEIRVRARLAQLRVMIDPDQDGAVVGIHGAAGRPYCG